MTAYGNGECVKFISLKALGLLAVYQGFCAIPEDAASIFVHYPCKNIHEIISFSPYDCFSLNLGHIYSMAAAFVCALIIIRGESNVT